jgi:hypothetical protein
MEQWKENRAGSPTIVAVGLVVFAFMALSLAVAATRTARFVAAMEFSIRKEVLLIAVIAFGNDVRRAFRASCARLVRARHLQRARGARDDLHSHTRRQESLRPPARAHLL